MLASCKLIGFSRFNEDVKFAVKFDYLSLAFPFLTSAEVRLLFGYRAPWHQHNQDSTSALLEAFTKEKDREKCIITLFVH